MLFTLTHVNPIEKLKKETLRKGVQWFLKQLTKYFQSHSHTECSRDANISHEAFRGALVAMSTSLLVRESASSRLCGFISFVFVVWFR